MKKEGSDSSWEGVSGWYNKSVGKEGHYYHRKIVLPGVLRLLELNKTPQPQLLDLACGQGVLARLLPPGVSYVGVDASASLIEQAKKEAGKQQQFFTADVTKPLPLQSKEFTHATLILALQNIEKGAQALAHASAHLQKGGMLVCVLNHPCFRIPRQSSWHVDSEKRIQYRRLDRYLSSLRIPILAHPGKGENSEQTLSFHNPLSVYASWLKEAGLLIENIEEWCSDKQSEGGAALMENRARAEFPLFLALVARKLK